MQKELNSGSPGLTERCDELDEQCTRTCGILRVWLTDRVLSSLNGIMAWRRRIWRKDSDGDDPSHRDRAPSSMEHPSLSRVCGRMEKRYGKGCYGTRRGDRGALLLPSVL